MSSDFVGVDYQDANNGASCFLSGLFPCSDPVKNYYEINLASPDTPYRIRNQSLANFFGNEDIKTLFGVLSLRKTRCHLMGGNDLSV